MFLLVLWVCEYVWSGERRRHRPGGDTSLLGMTQITFIASCGAPHLQFQYKQASGGEHEFKARLGYIWRSRAKTKQKRAGISAKMKPRKPRETEWGGVQLVECLYEALGSIPSTA